MIAVDTVPPAYATLLEHEGPEVVARAAQLDMPAAFADISQNAGKLDTPGGQYRELFLQLGKALGQSDLARALQLVESAVAVASTQGWFHMHVPVRAALGGALAAEGSIPEDQDSVPAAGGERAARKEEGDPRSSGLRKAALAIPPRPGVRIDRGDEFGRAVVSGKHCARSGERRRRDAPRLLSACVVLLRARGGPEAAYRWAAKGSTPRSRCRERHSRHRRSLTWARRSCHLRADRARG